MTATLVFPSRTLRNFRVLAGSMPPTYRCVPSYSKPTGTASGWPSLETVAIRASCWDRR